MLCIVYRFGLVVLLSVVVLATDFQQFCPPGFIRNDTGSCVCWKHHLQGILQCDEDNGVAKIANGYCMTFNDATNLSVVGKCLFQNYSSFRHNSEILYSTLPDSVYDLEPQLCGEYHRKGLLCYKCEDSYGPSVTLSMDCVPCNNVFGYYGRFVYVLIQAILVTVVYLFIMVFSIRLTKSPMNCFILFAQVIVNMLKYDPALYAHFQYAIYDSSFLNVFMKLVISFYGFFNLDLIPVILPPFCIATSLQGMHLYLLQYAIALYPLILTAFIYFLVTLYTRHFKPVVYIWRAIKYCLSPKLCCGLRRFLNKISAQDLANSFASFLLLAYSSIVFITVSFFLPIKLYTVSTNITHPETVLYYDPPDKYFGPKHWPYAIFAFALFVFFQILPLLLLFLYPLCSCHCVCIKCSSHSIRFFVESFQGWFKDGTEGTRDFRLVSCISPLLRIIFGLIVALVSLFVEPASAYYNARWFFIAFMFILASLLFSIAKPYKLEYMNSLETLLYSLLAVISFLASSWLGIYLIFLLCPIPMVVLIVYVIYRILKQLLPVVRGKCFLLISHYRKNGDVDIMTESADEHSFPHRLEKPELYHCRHETPKNLNSFPPLLKHHTDSYGTLIT